MHFARDEFVLVQLNMQTSTAQHYTTDYTVWQYRIVRTIQHQRHHTSAPVGKLLRRCHVPVRVAAYTSAEDEPSERRNVPGAVLDVCKTSLKEHYGAAAAEQGRSRVKPCSNMS